VIQIKTTGLEDYLDGDGGTSNIKCLVLGRPGSGKTRAASFWKRPFLCDFEDGRSVLADRGIPYVRIRSLAEAKETLQYIRREVGKPSRAFDTVIVDTIDGFQMTSVRERLKKVSRERLEAFEGDYDAVNNPVKEFIQGLLELDVNVVVNAHIKEAGQVKVKGQDSKKAKLGDDTLNITQAWSVDMVGGIREQVAGWFDLVALMENEWDLQDGKKVIKRHLRWQPTPEIPFLKDRLYAFGDTTPVRFADSDYTQLAEMLANKAKGLAPSQDVDVIGEPVQIAAPDANAGPVVADPSGVLPRPRANNAAPKSTNDTTAPTPTAVETVQDVLGGQVIAEHVVPRDYAAEAEQCATRADVKAIWNDALQAGALDAALKARLTVIGKGLSQ